MADATTTRKLDGTGLQQVWAEINDKFVGKEPGKVLSDNNLTNELVEKINSADEKIKNLPTTGVQSMTQEEIQAICKIPPEGV